MGHVAMWPHQKISQPKKTNTEKNATAEISIKVFGPILAKNNSLQVEIAISNIQGRIFSKQCQRPHQEVSCFEVVVWNLTDPGEMP